MRELCSGTDDDPVCDAGSSCLNAYENSVALCLALCDPLLQDCEPGLGCHYNFYAETFNCWPGEVAEGDPCPGFPDDCAPGLVCLSSDVVPLCADDSCCTAFCDLDSPVCATPGTECTSLFEVDMAPVGFETVGVCIVPP